jgi:hypothetical protein
MIEIIEIGALVIGVILYTAWIKKSVYKSIRNEYIELLEYQIDKANSNMTKLTIFLSNLDEYEVKKVSDRIEVLRSITTIMSERINNLTLRIADLENKAQQ